MALVVALVASTMALVGIGAPAGASDGEGTPPVPAPSGSGIGTKTVERTATLGTDAQDLWGGATPPGQLITLVDERFGGAGRLGHVEQECLRISEIDFKECAKLGAEIDASVSGELGMSLALEGLEGGTVSVTYPVTLELTAPADASFDPGDTVAITTSLAVDTERARIDVDLPDLETISWGMSLHAAASASARMCFVDCTRRTLFDESGGAAAELVRIDDPARFGGCFDLATSIALGLDRYPSGRCDDGGYLVNPDVQLTSTVEADGSVTATGSDQYGVFPVSGVTWAGRATGVPWWLPLNVNDLTANRVTIGWTTFNSVVTAVETLHQEMRLDPTIDVTLGWEGTRAFSVADGTSGEERGHGEGTDATFRVGDTLRLTTDAGDSSAIAVTPSLSMAEATMTNSTRSKSTGSLDLRALSFTLETPRVRICPPDPFDCTTVLSAIDTSEGPLVRHRVDLGQSSAHTVFDGSFEVGGFNTPVLEAFELVPRPVVEVRSSVVPANAPGRFDLLVDGEARAVDVADGGSTGRLVLDPGTHAIGEAAGAATTLDWFEVSITCVDAHTGTPHATGDPADVGSGTGIDLALEGGDDVVCTVQNRLPVPAECDAMTFDEVILGTPGDDVLVGTSGADLIVGYGGDDEIAAGPGDDCVAGGDGDDAISLGAGDDVAAGDGGDDILNGAHGDDVLRGGDGDDILNGAHGDDVLDGGRGVDRLNGGGGTDLCTSGSSVTGCEASPVDQDGPGDGRVGRGGPPANRVTDRAGHDS